jgi:hypothetical protein
MENKEKTAGFQQLYQDVVTHVLKGKGFSPEAERQAAFDNADDVRPVLTAGASKQQVEDALAVSFAFNTTNRLADAFGFFVPSADAFEAGAKYLLKRGYQ